MKLNRVKFRGFGRWVEREFTFARGINLIEAPNEAGKSTLLQGILALWYGAKKEGLKVKKEADWYQIYRPWQGSEYGGEIEYQLQGRSFRLIRTLFLDQDKEQLIDLTKMKEVTAEFPMDRRKDHLFLEKQTGLSGESFRRIAFLTSGAFSGKKEKDQSESQMVEKLKSLISQGGDMDITPAVKQLERQLNDIGTSKSAGKPYGALLQQQEEQAKEIRQLKEKAEQAIREKKEWTELEKELELLSATRAEIQRQVRIAREKAEQQQQLDSLRQELKTLTLKQQALQKEMDGYRSSLQKKQGWEREKEQHHPRHFIQRTQYYELQQKWKQKQTWQEQLAQLTQKIEDLSDSIHNIQTKNKTLLQLDESQAAQWLHQLKEFQRIEQRNAKYITLLEETDKIPLAELEQDLTRLDLVQRQEKQLQQEKRIFDQQIAESMFFEQQGSLSRSVKTWLIGTVLGGMSTLLTLYFLPIIFFLPGAFTVFALYQWMKANKEKHSQSERRFKEMKNIQQKGQTVAVALEQLMEQQEQLLQKWQVQSVSELYQKKETMQLKVMRQEEYRQELAHNESLLEGIRQRVKQWLSTVVDELPPFDVNIWIHTIEDLLIVRQRVRVQLTQLQLECKTSMEEEKRTRAQLSEVEKFLNQWEEQFDTTDLQQVNMWVEQSERVRELEQKIAEEQVLIERLEQKKKAERWEKQLERLAEEIDACSVRIQAQTTEMDGNIDWKVCLQELEREGEQIEQSWDRQKTRVDQLQGSIGKLEEWVRVLPDKESEWECTKQKLQDLERERKALEFARELLLEASQEVKENIAPQLTPYASRWITRVTDERYQELFIDSAQGLQLNVFVPETGESMSVEQLSRGTIDQMVFALRLSLVQFLSDHTNICLPLILDDCFVHFDEERLRASLALLKDFSASHQIIICTCHDRERRILDQDGISYHRIWLGER